MNSSSYSSFRAAQNVEDQDYDWFEEDLLGWDRNDDDPVEGNSQDEPRDDELREEEDRLEFSIEDYDLDSNSKFESFESDEPDWYALGYDAFKSGYSQIPPSSIFGVGHSAVTLWNNGYRQSVEDRMGNIGVRKNGKKV